VRLAARPLMRSGNASRARLGGGALGPGASLLFSGPFFSRDDRGTPDEVGAASVAPLGGFQVIAPDKTVTDRAGEAAAPVAASTRRPGRRRRSQPVRACENGSCRDPAAHEQGGRLAHARQRDEGAQRPSNA
jgi:hypothetical protein